MSREPACLGPAVAGTWYPADAEALRQLVDRQLHEAPAPPEQRPLALIEPHAGFSYSGNVAANGFRRLGDHAIERVLLLGPSHYHGFQGGALPRSTRMRTPLGEVEVDVDGVEALLSGAAFRRTDEPFEPEHSLEAELPFLQRLLPGGFRVLPVLMGGGSSPDANARVAEQLARLYRPDDLIVVSSDFTHYGEPFGYVPFHDDIPQKLEQLDREAFALIQARDRPGFQHFLSRTEATICGKAAIDVLLQLLPGDSGGTLTAYDTSGNMTGDWRYSVSYAAIAFNAGPGSSS